MTDPHAQAPAPSRVAAHPLPADVRAAIRARADERTAPLVEALLRPSLILSPATNGTGADGPETGSTEAASAEADAPAPADAVPVGRLGGLPRLPEGVEWPEFAGRPMQLLAQLDCAALAEAFEQSPLPADGLLLFFHDDRVTDFRGAGCRVLHLPAGSPPRPAPEQAALVPAVPVRARRALSAPAYQDLELESLFPDDFMTAMDIGMDLRELLPEADVRVLGWCDTDTGRPEGHRPLLQVESRHIAVEWGELVNVSFWITDEDLAAGRFEHVRQGFEIA